MPLPIAHALMGASVVAAFHPLGSFKQTGKFLLLGAALGALPDFDYALTLARVGGKGWHHQFAHSILFAFLVGLVAAAIINHFSPRTVTVFFLATLSHSVLDFLFTESRGVELFWPVSDKFFRLGLRPPISYNWRMYPLSAKITDILVLCFTEFAFFTTILLAILWLRGRRGAFNR
jgi:membrane-bound metal-dependent hydrolase YbcI (DUF457 family)